MIFAAAILRKLGETSIELTSEDIAAVPLDRVKFSVGKDDTVTIHIEREPNPDQGELPLARDTTRIPACDLTDDELQGEFQRVCNLIDGFGSDKDFEGHGGSPGEWMHERINEIETEAKRRGAPLT